jgi:hypothetical protein
VGWIAAAGAGVLLAVTGLILWLVPGAAAAVFPGVGGAAAASTAAPYDVVSKKGR